MYDTIVSFSFLGIELTKPEQALYENIPLIISERWQAEIADTVFHTVNNAYDKIDAEKLAKQREILTTIDEKDSDCILHGYLQKKGGPFSTKWLTHYAKLYPNRIELHMEDCKPELTFTDQIKEISVEIEQVKNKQSIVIHTKCDGKIVLTSDDKIGLKEWIQSLQAAHKYSLELLSSVAKKGGKVYGTDDDNAGLESS